MNANVVLPILKQFLGLDEIARADAVVANRDDPFVGFRERDQRLRESLTAVEKRPLRGAGGAHHASSLSASSICSREGTLWCHSTWSSMKERPLPLMVC